MGPSSSAVNGKVYAIGGFRIENHEVEIVEAYDPATDTWTRRKDLPTPRYHAGVHAPAAGGKIYVIGGHDYDSIIKTMAVYDPAADKWTAGKSIPGGRMAFDTAVVKGFK